MLFSSCNLFLRFNEHLLPHVTTTIDKVSAGYATLLLAPQDEGSGGGEGINTFVIEKNVCCTTFHITKACRPTCAKTASRVKQVRSNSFRSQFHCAYNTSK
jgi:hypothetical protein